VTVHSQPAPTIPNGQVLLKGALRYFNFGSGPGFHPIRGLRVEIRSGSGTTVVRTDDSGRFAVLAPTDTSFRARLVGEIPGGQINFIDNSATWFWSPQEVPLTACGAKTFCLSFDETQRDPGYIYRAADDLYEATVKLKALGVTPDKLGPVRVIPQSATYSVTTWESPGFGVIWVNRDAIWSGSVLHELGHVIALRNSKYQAWAAPHSGCDAVGWPRAEFAFFEGWANFIQFVLRPDKTRANCPEAVPPTPTPTPSSSCKATDFCRSGASPNACHAQGVSMLCNEPVHEYEKEDYVANCLIETSLRADPTGKAILDAFMSKAFRDTPAPTGTLHGFRGILQSTSPAVGQQLQATMAAYGMSP
jgi:hypothetical protein